MPAYSTGSDPAALAIAITESSQVGESRRHAARLAERTGFDGSSAARVALVAVELATNLVKHARDGEMLLRPLERAGVGGIEFLALNRGPGMADVGKCLRDGYSTAGSPGTGLGAVARQSETLDIYSTPKAGTAVLARLWSGPSPRAVTADPLDVGAVCVPKQGQQECGDAWAAEPGGDGGAVFLLADGLGHGPRAADASRQAVQSFRANARLGPVEIVRAMHAALQGTLGAVVGVARLDLEARLLRFAGVGNIAATVVSGGKRTSTASYNGTLGHVLNKVQEFVYPFPAGALLVMHSDGLRTRWDFGAYPGLEARDPAMVAGVLYRDFKRGRDDVTVLAAREREG
jgi:anti-sigma regulatory factor (Ser/Thr protein kinase)